MARVTNSIGAQFTFTSLGLDEREMFARLEAFGGQQPGGLRVLGDGFSRTWGGLSPAIASAARQFLAAQNFVPAPNMGACGCRGQYAPSQGSASSAFMYGGGGTAHAEMVGMFDGMMRAAASNGVMPSFNSPYNDMMLSGMGQMMQRGQSGQASTAQGMGSYGYNGMGGYGQQQFQAGTPGQYQGSFGLSASGGDDVAGVLNDPTLTVEDKVTLMIMLIMKKMDKDIEKAAQDINKLQQQQSQGAQGGGGGGKGGGGGGAAAGGDKSIDVETMKMKRLIDKRGQMFDMLRQIIDKYNQTAKGIIDSIGR